MATQRITPDKIYEENEYDVVRNEINSNQVLVIRDKNGKKNNFERIAVYIEETAPSTDKRVGFLDVRTGKRFLSRTENILGVLKTEFITEKDKLMLALIKPITEKNVEEFALWGCCYLKNGTHQKLIRLSSERELRAYISLQRQYQSRIMVYDEEDYIVMDIQEGRVIFSDMEQTLREHLNVVELE